MPTQRRTIVAAFALVTCILGGLLVALPPAPAESKHVALDVTVAKTQTKAPAEVLVVKRPASSPDQATKAEVAKTETAQTPVKGVEERKSSDASRAKGEINFDDLKFEIDKDARFHDEMLKEADVKKLDGKKVKLRGYILPATLFKETGIDQFVLVRDNQECCFGPGAALFDCVIVEMVPGKTTDFVTRPVTVEGKFKIDTKKYRYPGGVGPKNTSHFAIFKIDGESVK